MIVVRMVRERIGGCGVVFQGRREVVDECYSSYLLHTGSIHDLFKIQASTFL